MTAEALPMDTADHVVAVIELARIVDQIGDMVVAYELWSAAVDEAERIGLRGLPARAEVGRLGRLPGDPGELTTRLRRLIVELKASGELRGESEAWFLLSNVFWRDGRAADMQAMERETIRCLQELGDEAEARRQMDSFVAAAALGPMPVSDGLDLCRSLIAETQGLPSLVSVRRNQAWLLGMRGDSAEASTAIERAFEIARELATMVDLVSNVTVASVLAQMEGRPAAAVEYLREAVSILDSRGEVAFRGRYAGRLAEALLEVGGLEEAEVLAAEAESSTLDKTGRVLSLAVLARVAAARGRHDDALVRAKEAVEVALTTDFPDVQARAFAHLGAVHEAAGRTAAARRALKEAIRIHERKENLVGARLMRERLAKLG